jgi:hypothetical protein
MKIRAILYVFCYFIMISEIAAQKEIKTRWYQNTLDTFYKDPQDWDGCLPFELIDLNNKEFILQTYDFGGWTTRKINKMTGKNVWLYARNKDYPTNEQKNYYNDNLFLRPDGNLEALGVKSIYTGSSIYGDGNPFKVIIDINTGKEIATVHPKQPSLKKATVAKPSPIFAYMPKADKSGYYHVSHLRNEKATFVLRTIDTNLIIKDTLAWLYEGKDPAYPDINFIYRISYPHLINDNIYFNFYYRKLPISAGNSNFYFYKISTKGEVKIVKDLAQPLYYLIQARDEVRISDGYLFTGYVDTTYNLFLAPNVSTTSGMVAKVDTNGNVVWKSFLRHPSNGLIKTIGSVEDKKRNGYWAYAGNVDEKNSYLYFIDNNGKSRFIAKIIVADNKQDLFASKLWLLNDGSLVASFRYKEAYYNDQNTSLSWGVTMIDAADLDNALATSTPDVLPDFLVSLYPNPAHDLLNINILDNFDPLQVECFDIQGRKVYQCDFQNATQINTAAWSRGLYAIVIRDERGRLVKAEKIVLE